MGISRGFRALVSLLLAYVVAMAMLATLWPLDFQATPHGWSLETSLEDLALNLALLAPVAFMWRLAGLHRRWPYDLDALALGCGFSLLLECLQTLLPSRCSSPTDVFTNALGAWAGAAAHTRARPWLERRLIDQLCLMQPLAKVAFLTLPLVTLQALTSTRSAGAWNMAPLLVFVAFLGAALARHRLTHGHSLSHMQSVAHALVFSAALALVSAPLSLRFPREGLELASMSALAFWLTIRHGVQMPAGERRVEVVAVRRGLPWFGLYIAMIGYQRFIPGDEYSAQGAARGLSVLRDVAAFTVLGYVVSQLHARSGAPGWRARAMVGAYTLSACLVFALLRASVGALDPTELLMLGGVAALGAAVHRAELRMIKAWRSRESLRPHSPAGESGFPNDLLRLS
jgi:VanZ family protein